MFEGVNKTRCYPVRHVIGAVSVASQNPPAGAPAPLQEQKRPICCEQMAVAPTSLRPLGDFVLVAPLASNRAPQALMRPAIALAPAIRERVLHFVVEGRGLRVEGENLSDPQPLYSLPSPLYDKMRHSLANRGSWVDRRAHERLECAIAGQRSH